MRQEKKTAFSDCQQSKLIKLVNAKMHRSSLTIDDLSTLTGISQPAIRDALLNGKAPGEADTAAKLAKWVNTPMTVEHYPHGKRIAIMKPSSDFHSWIFYPLSYTYTAKSWEAKS